MNRKEVNNLLPIMNCLKIVSSLMELNLELWRNSYV